MRTFLSIAIVALAGCSISSRSSVLPASTPDSAHVRAPYVYIAGYDVNGKGTYGQVSVYAPLATTPLRVLKRGIPYPVRMAVDASHTLYVLNRMGGRYGEGVIDVIPPGATSPSRVFSQPQGYGAAYDLAFDKPGNLYVANTQPNAGNVAVYAAGTLKLLRTITKGVNYPVRLALDSSDNLYVSNYEAPSVTVYASGSTKVLRTIRFSFAKQQQPYGLAFDAAGNLYVCNHPPSNNVSGSVLEYKAGTATLLRTITNGINAPADLLFDASGYLYVLNFGTVASPGSVSEYAPRSSTAAVSVCCALTRAMAVDSSSRLYVLVYTGSYSPGSLSVFAPHSAKVERTFTSGILSEPLALALSGV